MRNSSLSKEDLLARDTYFMMLARAAARQAYKIGEVPVGAVIVQSDKVISYGFNQSISNRDPSAHAEIVAIRAASRVLSNYRIPNCELYVTLEPCLMCAGAMIHARITRVVFGAYNLKTGACGSVVNIFTHPQFNHHPSIDGGVLEEECSRQLSQFFVERRKHLCTLRIPRDTN
ncbi:tRNA adenosine(34) deaminase TadA [Candidatus Vallotia tarda]|uniref:tRNA-specific adenosine deaminase n=1 Tax=Candidatus Vallotiella hemipterorum TaxID=1177213 RepID=A0A916JUD2_9BURK|nr:tRNA adenosine(34) deaminase TadA [Candidatus Vallotia tarda]CAG7601837.1 tRNA-specific adenosine deaminase [Candidatus Vallotia tarda]